jgi:diketogulonate reductase-like aldo/keto reductase
MELTLTSTVRLNTGSEMPRLGLGVWEIPAGGRAAKAVQTALKVGYRHIDTARAYRNEADVGEGLRASGLSRDEVFVTTKLLTAEQGFKSGLKACEASLKRLELDYVDLYLIHFPQSVTRAPSWSALRKLHEDGKARAIGVSNYTVRHLEELLTKSDVVPAVNQVEFSPFLYQRELAEYCEKQGIALTAYSPLTRTERLDDPTLTDVAGAHGKSPAQVMIRWSLQHGNIVIPKSASPKRIRENADVFDFSLSAEEMARLDALDEGYRTCWDPSDVP